MLTSKDEIAAAFAAASGVIQQQQLRILRRMLNHWLLISTTRSLITNWSINRRRRQTSVIGIKMARHLLPRSTASRRSVFDGMKKAWKKERQAAQALLEAGANFRTITPQDDKINGLKSLQQMLKRWSSISQVRILHQLKLKMVQAEQQFQLKIKALRGMGQMSINQMIEIMRLKRANVFGTLRRNWTDSESLAVCESLAVDTLSEQLLAKQHECDKLQQENDAFSQMVEGLESEISRLQVNLQTLHAHPLGFKLAFMLRLCVQQSEAHV